MLNYRQKPILFYLTEAFFATFKSPSVLLSIGVLAVKLLS